MAKLVPFDKPAPETLKRKVLARALEHEEPTSLTQICNELGMGTNKPSVLLKDEEFKGWWEAVKAVWTDQVEVAVAKLALEGDLAAGLRWLQAKGGPEWHPQPQPQMSQGVQIVIKRGTSDDDE